MSANAESSFKRETKRNKFYIWVEKMGKQLDEDGQLSEKKPQLLSFIDCTSIIVYWILNPPEEFKKIGGADVQIVSCDTEEAVHTTNIG